MIFSVRDTLYEYAPKDTVASARFFLSDKNNDLLESWIKDLPLVSGSPVTWKDVSPYMQKEFVVFLSKDGKTTLAFRKSDNVAFQDFVTKNNLMKIEPKNKIALLSTATVSLEPLHIKTRYLIPISWTKRKWVGEWVETETRKRSELFLAKNTLVIRSDPLAFKIKKQKRIPEGTFAYLSTPVLTNVSKSLTDQFFILSESLLGKELFSLLQTLSQTQNSIFLTRDELGDGFILKQEQKNENKHDIEQSVRLLMSFLYPIIQKSTLDDGSIVREMVNVAQNIDMEERDVSGIHVYEAKNDRDVLFGGKSKQGEIFFTNREYLVNDAENDENQTASILCEGTIGGVKTFEILKQRDVRFPSQKSELPLLLLQKISSIGINSGLFYSNIVFCR